MKTIALVNSTEVVLVDDSDWSALLQYRWLRSESKKNHVYAVTSIKHRNVYMHKMLLPDAKLVDHKDGNGLNNQRDNLRASNYSINQANRKVIKRPGATSKYKGVHFDKTHNRFVASLMVSGKPKRMGKFTNELDAAKAYNRANNQPKAECENRN